MIAPSLTGLTRLNLAACERVGDEESRVLSQLTNLTQLHSADCTVTDEGVRAFGPAHRAH
jgi:hypothetical protein